MSNCRCSTCSTCIDFIDICIGIVILMIARIQVAIHGRLHSLVVHDVSVSCRYMMHCFLGLELMMLRTLIRM